MAPVPCDLAELKRSSGSSNWLRVWEGKGARKMRKHVHAHSKEYYFQKNINTYQYVL